MECSNCHRENDTGAKFCKYCGGELVKGSTKQGSVDRYFYAKTHTCQICGKVKNLKYVAFYQNIGKFFQREYRYVKGYLCKDCIDEYFWKFTGITLFLGWWGTISFFVTPFYLLNNIGRYIMTLGMNKNE